ETKKAEVDKLIAACAGLYVESSTTAPAVSPGQGLPIKFEAINRSSVPVKLINVRAPVSGESMSLDTDLARDQFFTRDLNPTVPPGASFTQPYWLRKPSTLGTFAVDDQQLIGLPENPPAFPMEITVSIAGAELRYTINTRFRRVD